jgi:hypothetical protein
LLGYQTILERPELQSQTFSRNKHLRGAEKMKEQISNSVKTRAKITVEKKTILLQIQMSGTSTKVEM